MRRIIGGVLAAILTAGVGVAVAAPAQADYCQGSSYSGQCYEVKTVTKKKTLVEQVIMTNKSKVNVEATCEFSKSITKSLGVTATAGGSVSASVKAAVFASVDAEVSYSVSTSLSQSATSATKMGGKFTLKPGQQVTCNRYYLEAAATVRKYSYSGTTSKTLATYSTKVPSAFQIVFA